MEEIKSIDIKTDNGDVVSANVITFIENEENKKEYVLYSIDTDDIGEMGRIYASIFIQNENGYELLPIEDDEEWNQLKEEIIKLTKEGE